MVGTLSATALLTAANVASAVTYYSYTSDADDNLSAISTGADFVTATTAASGDAGGTTANVDNPAASSVLYFGGTSTAANKTGIKLDNAAASAYTIGFGGTASQSFFYKVTNTAGTISRYVSHMRAVDNADLVANYHTITPILTNSAGTGTVSATADTLTGWTSSGATSAFNLSFSNTTTGLTILGNSSASTGYVYHVGVTGDDDYATSLAVLKGKILGQIGQITFVASNDIGGNLFLGDTGYGLTNLYAGFNDGAANGVAYDAIFAGTVYTANFKLGYPDVAAVSDTSGGGALFESGFYASTSVTVTLGTNYYSTFVPVIASALESSVGTAAASLATLVSSASSTLAALDFTDYATTLPQNNLAVVASVLGAQTDADNFSSTQFSHLASYLSYIKTGAVYTTQDLYTADEADSITLSGTNGAADGSGSDKDLQQAAIVLSYFFADPTYGATTYTYNTATGTNYLGTSAIVDDSGTIKATASTDTTITETDYYALNDGWSGAYIESATAAATISAPDFESIGGDAGALVTTDTGITQIVRSYGQLMINTPTMTVDSDKGVALNAYYVNIGDGNGETGGLSVSDGAPVLIRQQANIVGSTDSNGYNIYSADDNQYGDFYFVKAGVIGAYSTTVTGDNYSLYADSVSFYQDFDGTGGTFVLQNKLTAATGVTLGYGVTVQEKTLAATTFVVPILTLGENSTFATTSAYATTLTSTTLAIGDGATFKSGGSYDGNGLSTSATAVTTGAGSIIAAAGSDLAFTGTGTIRASGDLTLTAYGVADSVYTGYSISAPNLTVEADSASSLTETSKMTLNLAFSDATTMGSAITLANTADTYSYGTSGDGLNTGTDNGTMPYQYYDINLYYTAANAPATGASIDAGNLIDWLPSNADVMVRDKINTSYSWYYNISDGTLVRTTATAMADGDDAYGIFAAGSGPRAYINTNKTTVSTYAVYVQMITPQPTPQIATPAASMVSARLAGAAGARSNSIEAAMLMDDTSSIAYGEDAENIYGIWAEAYGSRAKQTRVDSTSVSYTGFKNTGYGGVFGGDIKINPEWVLGAAFTLGHNKQAGIDLGNGRSVTNSRIYAGTFYAQWAHHCGASIIGTITSAASKNSEYNTIAGYANYNVRPVTLALEGSHIHRLSALDVIPSLGVAYERTPGYSYGYGTIAKTQKVTASGKYTYNVGLAIQKAFKVDSVVVTPKLYVKANFDHYSKSPQYTLTITGATSTISGAVLPYSKHNQNVGLDVSVKGKGCVEAGLSYDAFFAKKYFGQQATLKVKVHL